MSAADVRFTGERLHEQDALFGVDLVRHRAAYRHAIELALERGFERVLELGSGTGYGTRELAEALPLVVAIDRVAPLANARAGRARFIRADLDAMPIAGAHFDLVVSFQVIEHLAEPTAYLDAMARGLRPDGVALLSTPNRRSSDGENPYHVHEYTAEELVKRLARHFEEVEMLGVSAIGDAERYHEARLKRIRRIVRLDPLGLRRTLPRGLVEWLFARFAILVRRGIASESALAEVGLGDYPIEPAHPKSLDLLARCRGPKV